MKHLRLPCDVSVEHIAGQLQRQADRVAIVVVSDVMSPIDQRRPILVWMSEMPVIDVDHAIPSVNLNHGCDQSEDVVSDVLNVSAFVYGETIGEFHKRSWCACFR